MTTIGVIAAKPERITVRATVDDGRRIVLDFPVDHGEFHLSVDHDSIDVEMGEGVLARRFTRPSVHHLNVDASSTRRTTWRFLPPKPMIVGEAPSRRTAYRPPLSGSSGDRLAKLAGLDDLSSEFELRNLVDSYPGRSGKGSRFPVRRAQVAANALVGQFAGRHVVLLGRRVANCFGMGRCDYFDEWSFDDDSTLVLFPHPSRVNRWWNDRANERAARRYLRRLVP